jgi:predicted secreted Zn-dependent protease
MKTIDNEDFENTYEEKVQDIKKRKRALRFIQDPNMVKKIKKDLKREQRGVKRSEKHELREWIKNELNKD